MSYLLHFRRYALPFRAPVRTAHGVWPVREGLLLRLADKAGNVGYGEACPVPLFGQETTDADEDACRTLGESVDEQVSATVPRELACLRHALAAALAGVRSSIEPSMSEGPAAETRDHLPVAALLPAGRAALPQVAPKAEAGFRTFKWKVGVGDVADELGLLDDLCGALPEGAKLRLDANGAWDRRRAERWLDRCADRPVEFVEQPIAADARGAEDLLRGLAEDYPTPLALDESLVGDRDLDRWLDLGWPGVWVVKPVLFADVTAALARLAKAEAPVVFSSALETAVGAQGALRAAFGWRGEVRALGFGVWPLFEDRRCNGPTAAAFLHREDVERLNPEDVWTALN